MRKDIAHELAVYLEGWSSWQTFPVFGMISFWDFFFFLMIFNDLEANWKIQM